MLLGRNFQDVVLQTPHMGRDSIAQSFSLLNEPCPSHHAKTMVEDTAVAQSTWLWMGDMRNLVQFVVELTMGNSANIAGRSNDSWMPKGEALGPRSWLLVEDRSKERLVELNLWVEIVWSSKDGESVVLRYFAEWRKAVEGMRTRSDAENPGAIVVVVEGVPEMSMCLRTDSLDGKTDLRGPGYHECRWRMFVAADRRAK